MLQLFLKVLIILLRTFHKIVIYPEFSISAKGKYKMNCRSVFCNISCLILTLALGTLLKDKWLYFQLDISKLGVQNIYFANFSFSLLVTVTAYMSMIKISKLENSQSCYLSWSCALSLKRCHLKGRGGPPVTRIPAQARISCVYAQPMESLWA